VQGLGFRDEGMSQFSMYHIHIHAYKCVCVCVRGSTLPTEYWPIRRKKGFALMSVCIYTIYYTHTHTHRQTDTHHLANRILPNEEDERFRLNVSVRQRRRKKVVVAVVLFQREKRPAAHHLRTYASELARFPHPPMLDANARPRIRKQMRKERDARREKHRQAQNTETQGHSEH
jgi:hypothetical protein